MATLSRGDMNAFPIVSIISSLPFPISTFFVSNPI